MEKKGNITLLFLLLAIGLSAADSVAVNLEIRDVLGGAISNAKAVAYAIEQPDDVDINELVIRPTVQEF